VDNVEKNYHCLAAVRALNAGSMFKGSQRFKVRFGGGIFTFSAFRRYGNERGLSSSQLSSGSIAALLIVEALTVFRAVDTPDSGAARRHVEKYEAVKHGQFAVVLDGPKTHGQMADEKGRGHVAAGDEGNRHREQRTSLGPTRHPIPSRSISGIESGVRSVVSQTTNREGNSHVSGILETSNRV
jgi:hypothetical protein